MSSLACTGRRSTLPLTSVQLGTVVLFFAGMSSRSSLLAITMGYVIALCCVSLYCVTRPRQEPSQLRSLVKFLGLFAKVYHCVRLCRRRSPLLGLQPLGNRDCAHPDAGGLLA